MRLGRRSHDLFAMGAGMRLEVSRRLGGEANGIFYGRIRW
jgi:hypothetical protein